MTSIIVHMTQAELAAAYSALRARERKILEIAEDLAARGLTRTADKMYAAYATTALLSERMRKHLERIE